jgi:hypothetical protein
MSAEKYVSPNGYSDAYGPNVANILAGGSRVVRASVPQEVRAQLREAVKDGVLGHLKKDGLKPEVFFHPSRRNEAIARQRAEEDYAKDLIAGVMYVKSVDERVAEALARIGVTP